METVTPSRRRSWILPLLVIAFFLRIYALDKRLPNHDELHCRGDMSQCGQWLLHHHFRNHSVRHEFSRAPHGLVPQLTSFVIGKTGEYLLGPILPEHDFKRDNILSRLGNVLFSVSIVALVYAFAGMLFQRSVAFALAVFTAFSPDQILWGRTEFGDVPLAFFALGGFFAVWRAIQRDEETVPWMAALLAGAGGALALGGKWSIVVLLPFYPLSYLIGRAARVSKGECRWNRGDVLFLGIWSMSLAAVTCSVLSLDSWQWAFAPPPGPYGDQKVSGGVLKMLAYGIDRTTSSWGNFNGAALYWGGPLFFITWLASLWVLGKGAVRRETRASFMACVMSGAALYVLLSLADWYAWRSYFIITVAIVCSGFWLETLNRQMMARWAGIVALSMLPMAIYCGWRLGTPPVLYHSSQFTFYDVLPEHPEYPVFPLRKHPLQHFRAK